jgi:hypothetical protein
MGGSCAPAVSEYREWGEDGDDAGAPEDGRCRVRGGRAAEQQGTDGVDGGGEGLVVGEPRSGPGMVRVSRKALEGNARRTVSGSDAAAAASALLAARPSSTLTQEMAKPNSSSTPAAAARAAMLVWGRKPTRYPTPSMRTMPNMLVSASARTRPASTAERAMTSDRNRFWLPGVAACPGECRAGKQAALNAAVRAGHITASAAARPCQGRAAKVFMLLLVWCSSTKLNAQLARSLHLIPHSSPLASLNSILDTC